MPLTGEKAKEYQREWNAKNREKRKAYSKAWRRKNVERVRAYSKRWWKSNRPRFFEKYRKTASGLRDEILRHYGHKCACCGESTKEFLCLDHVNGGGCKHRKKVPSGYMLYRWVIKNKFPASIRVLCHNCNMSLGIYGYCPHAKSL